MKFKDNITIDMKPFIQYQKIFEGFKQHWPQFLESYLNRLVGEVMEEVIPRTPVNKDPSAPTRGLLKRSWKITKINREGDTLSISIYNDASTSGPDQSYASHVEMGHATRNRKGFVEGVWMLTISITEVEKNANKIFKEEFFKYCKRMGI